MIDKEFIMSLLVDALHYEDQIDDYEKDAFWRIREAAAKLLKTHYGILALQKPIQALMTELENAR